MKRVLKGLLSACLMLGATPGAAQGTSPSAERLRAAAQEYDAGRRAYLEGKHAEAAVHFENAWHDAPRAEALRNAIRANREAKQLSRAATLAALGERVYADDTTTMIVVRDALDTLAPRLHKVTLTCNPACGVAADGRVISPEDAPRLVFFLDPGAHQLVVSWPGDRSKQAKVQARAGSGEELSFQAPEPVAAPPPAAPPQVTEPAPRSEAPAVSHRPFGPAVFVVGLSLTAVAGAATIVSGIDTLQRPGVDRVREECVGQGEACPAYQAGQSAQLRTNILLGTTAGLGLVTGVIGLFMTQWSAPAVTPRVSLHAGGASVGLGGAF